MPAITLSSFFPDWEHSGCIPLDGYRESNFAGTRNMQLLVSRENLSRIFVFSFQVHSLTMWYSWASQAKKSCSVGLRTALLETAANPAWWSIWSWFHSVTLWVPRLEVYPECCGQWTLSWAPVTCRYQTRCGLAQVTLYRVFGLGATGAKTGSVPDLVTCSTTVVQSMCGLLNKYHFVSIKLARAPYFSFVPAAGGQRILAVE